MPAIAQAAVVKEWVAPKEESPSTKTLKSTVCSMVPDAGTPTTLTESTDLWETGGESDIIGKLNGYLWEGQGMPEQTKFNWIRWKDVGQSLRMAGYMKDFSNGECRRLAKLLRNGVAAGTVLHKKEGSKSYWALAPESKKQK